jgi:hypothetical protein
MSPGDGKKLCQSSISKWQTVGLLCFARFGAKYNQQTRCVILPKLASIDTNCVPRTLFNWLPR